MTAATIPTPTSARPYAPSTSLGPAPAAPEPDEAAHREARELPLTTRFELGDRITPVQKAFLDQHGFLVFSHVVREHELRRALEEIDRIEREWLAEGRKTVHGIPVFVGQGLHGEPFIQRFAFTSVFSDYIRELVRDPRFAPVRGLIGTDARVGDEEKDGVVFNRNLNVPGSAYPRLGWHTDGLRDLFLNREVPGPMLNIGLHFDRVNEEDGGLRIIPGSHNQGFRDMCLRKPYFVWHRPDPNEIAVETEPGDLTVHDGRAWHRVEQSPHTGERSLRRTMYVPYLTDEYAPKSEQSPTPFYHRIGQGLRAAKRWLA